MLTTNFSNYENIKPNPKDEAIGFAAMSTGDVTPFHWHKAAEIIYIESGDLTVSYEHSEVSLSANEFTLINTGVIHSARSITGNTALILQIPDNFITGQLAFDEVPHFISPVPDDPKTYNTYCDLLKKLIEMHHVLKEKPPHYRLEFKSLLYSITYQIITECAIIDTSTQHQTDTNETLRKVIDYTNQHFTKHISIDEIASIAGFQPKYFCRFFKKNMSRTYFEYLAHIRLSYIVKDMIRTDIPLYKLKEQYHFTNDKLFSRTFKEAFGMSPTKFRQQMKL